MNLQRETLQREYANEAWYRQEALSSAIRGGRRIIRDVVLVAAIEAALQPEGRCIECDGGKGYWKHGPNVAYVLGGHQFRSPAGKAAPK